MIKIKILNLLNIKVLQRYFYSILPESPFMFHPVFFHESDRNISFFTFGFELFIFLVVKGIFCSTCEEEIWESSFIMHSK